MNGSIEYTRRADTSVKVYRDYGNHKTLFDSQDRYNYSDMVSAFEAMWAEIVSLRGQRTDAESEAAALREQLATVTQERDAAMESIKAMRDNVAQIELNREASQAHWLDEALNSGDGTYRP